MIDTLIENFKMIGFYHLSVIVSKLHSVKDRLIQRNERDFVIFSFKTFSFFSFIFFCVESSSFDKHFFLRFVNYNRSKMQIVNRDFACFN